MISPKTQLSTLFSGLFGHPRLVPESNVPTKDQSHHCSTLEPRPEAPPSRSSYDCDVTVVLQVYGTSADIDHGAAMAKGSHVFGGESVIMSQQLGLVGTRFGGC